MTFPAFAVTREGRPVRPVDFDKPVRLPTKHHGWPEWAELYEPQHSPTGEVIGHWFETSYRWGDIGRHPDTPLLGDLHWGRYGIVGSRQQAGVHDRVILVDKLALYVEARRREPFVPRLAIRMAWCAGSDPTAGVLDMLNLRPSAEVVLRFSNLRFAEYVANELAARVVGVRVEVNMRGRAEAR